VIANCLGERSRCFLCFLGEPSVCCLLQFENGDDGAAGVGGCGTVAQPGVGIRISVRREFRSMGCYEISTEDGRPLVAQFSYATLISGGRAEVYCGELVGKFFGFM